MGAENENRKSARTKGSAQLTSYKKLPVGHVLSLLYVDRHADSVRIFCFPLIAWNKQNTWKRRDALRLARICEGRRPRGHHNLEDKVTSIYINICSY